MFGEFAPLSSGTHPGSTGPSTSASAATENMLVDDCDSYLDGCSVFSGISDDSHSNADFSGSGLVETPVRPADIETAYRMVWVGG